MDQTLVRDRGECQPYAESHAAKPTNVWHDDVMSDSSISDRRQLGSWMADDLISDSVATFVEGPGIYKLNLSFDIDELRAALDVVVDRSQWLGQLDAGFGVVSLTRRPGADDVTDADLSGRYWLRADERYVEEPREEVVDEAAYSEFVPDFADTYFKHVYDALTDHTEIGRFRVLWKGQYNCNSWHRDPEPRLHIPIVTNPGALFVVNHHVTHMPADGSVYFTDTRAYHTAMNGGATPRVHLVAAIPT